MYLINRKVGNKFQQSFSVVETNKKMTDYSKVSIPKSLTEGQLQTQTETLQVPTKANKLVIGIPREETEMENLKHLKLS